MMPTLALYQYWVLIAVAIDLANGQSNCSRTNQQPEQNCRIPCTLSTDCDDVSDECRCDKDCGYSCVPKDFSDLSCGDPPRVRNAKANYQGTRVGDMVTYSCIDGYTLNGKRRQTCRADGNWDGVGPTCLQMCRKPVVSFPVVFGEVLNSDKLFATGESFTLACEEGYRQKGDPVIICIGGKWVRLPFECEATHSCRRTTRASRIKCTQQCSPVRGCHGNQVCLCDGQCGYSCVEKGLSCGDPPAVANGRRIFISTGYNATANYTCSEGFSFNRKNTVNRCTAKKKWENSRPGCNQDCKPPPLPRNATISNPKPVYRSGEKAHFKCKPGLNQEGTPTKMCFKGEWTTMPFKCSNSGCRDPGSLMNGRRLGDSFSTGSRVFFICNVGYKLSGPNFITCEKNESWSGAQPTCQIVECGRLSPPQNGYVSNSSTTFQSRNSFMCDEGYILIGSGTTTCQVDGKWSAKAPECQAVKCNALPTPVNGRKYGKLTTFPNKVRFECDAGFERNGPPERRCQANGTWSGASTTCKVKKPLKEKPSQPIVTFSNEDIQAHSLTIKWSPPADDGGSVVTGYRVRVPEDGFDKTYPVSDTGKEIPIEPLRKYTKYTLLVYARNAVGEGQPANKSFTTKHIGPPEVVTATYNSTKDPHIFTIRWNEPISNGAEVEGYDIYKRESGTNAWFKVQNLHKDARSFNISLSPGPSYQIAVTATNKFGEAIKVNRITIDVPRECKDDPRYSCKKFASVANYCSDQEAWTKKHCRASCEWCGQPRS